MPAVHAAGRPRPNTLRPWLWLGAAGLLALPAVAMWLDAPGVHWTALDFVAMGALLATACGLYELGVRLARTAATRFVVGLAILAAFLATWAHLALAD